MCVCAYTFEPSDENINHTHKSYKHVKILKKVPKITKMPFCPTISKLSLSKEMWNSCQSLPVSLSLNNTRDGQQFSTNRFSRPSFLGLVC